MKKKIKAQPGSLLDRQKHLANKISCPKKIKIKKVDIKANDEFPPNWGEIL